MLLIIDRYGFGKRTAAGDWTRHIFRSWSNPDTIRRADLGDLLQANRGKEVAGIFIFREAEGNTVDVPTRTCGRGRATAD